jgi:hypothetical protein
MDELLRRQGRNIKSVSSETSSSREQLANFERSSIGGLQATYTLDVDLFVRNNAFSKIIGSGILSWLSHCWYNDDVHEISCLKYVGDASGFNGNSEHNLVAKFDLN